jgi:two-component system, sporulation sensor kinase E
MREIEEQNMTDGGIYQQVSGLRQWIVELEETIAQLKSIDISLHELLSIFAGFADGLQQGLALVQDGNIVWANEAGCRMLGYKIEELIGASGTCLAHPDYREKLAVRLTGIQAGDVRPTYDLWPFMTKNQEIRQIKSYANRIVYDGKPAILTILVDATEEQKLQDELSMKSRMLDSVSDSVFLHDMDGNIKYVNKAACESLGYRQDEIIKMSVIDINAEELKRKAQSRLKMISPEKGGRFKTVHVRKNGSRMQVDVKVRVIKMGDQDLMLGIVREIIPEDLQDI